MLTEFVGAHKNNFAIGRDGCKILLIINHVMLGSLLSTRGWFNDGASGVSSHYGIGKDGTVLQFVRDEDIAFANGPLRAPNTAAIPLLGTLTQHPRYGMNPYTISIEYEGTHVGGTPGTVLYRGDALHVDLMPGTVTSFYTPTAAQYDAAVALITGLCAKHNIPTDRAHIGRHSDVDSVRKWFCPSGEYRQPGTPGGFPLAKLLTDVAANTPPAAPVIPLTLHIDQDAARTKSVSVKGPPNISPSVFRQVLVEQGSPAASDADELYQICVNRYIDPAVALAFYAHESTYGTDGVAVQTINWGNLRPGGRGGLGRALTTLSTDFGIFRRYGSWAASLRDWADLWNLSIYKDKSLRDQIALYAPSTDGNAPDSYYRHIVTAVRGEDGLGGYLARSGDFDYSAPNN